MSQKRDRWGAAARAIWEQQPARMVPCKRCGKPRPSGHGRQFCFDCSKGSSKQRVGRNRLPEGSTAPCKRCGEPRPRTQGRRFCFACSGHQEGPDGCSRTRDDREELLRMHQSGVPLTLEECAAVLGMTREGVRLIEKSALEKLRTALQDGEWGEGDGYSDDPLANVRKVLARLRKLVDVA